LGADGRWCAADLYGMSKAEIVMINDHGSWSARGRVVLGCALRVARWAGADRDRFPRGLKIAACLASGLRQPSFLEFKFKFEFE